jgi:hypothetical protein
MTAHNATHRADRLARVIIESAQLQTVAEGDHRVGPALAGVMSNEMAVRYRAEMIADHKWREYQALPLTII